MVRCEKIVLLDPGLANEHNVEQMLWKSVFYQMVELIRKQMADDHLEETKVSLHKILDEVWFYLTKQPNLITKPSMKLMSVLVL